MNKTEEIKTEHPIRSTWRYALVPGNFRIRNRNIDTAGRFMPVKVQNKGGDINDQPHI